MLLSSALIFWFMGRFFLQQISEMITQSLGSFLVSAARSGDYIPASIFVVKHALLVAVPFIGILCIMGVASTVLQVGFLQNEEALQLKFEKLNPVSGPYEANESSGPG